MKKLLFFLTTLLPLSVWAQGNHPLLKEGKEWRERADHIVYTYSYNEEGKSKGLDVNTHSEYYAYSIMGDTLINGKNFKKLYLCAGDTSYYCAMYEDGARVTYIPKGETNETMLYDFGHPVGEYVEWDEYWPRLYLLYEDAIEVGGQSFRRMNFTDEGEFLEDSVLVVRWVEGIGSTYEDLFQVCPVMGNSGFLTSVTLDGDTLFWYEGPSAYREYMMSVNHVTKDEPQVSGKRYDLSGRRIGSARKGQIIISDGKKIASPSLDKE